MTYKATSTTRVSFLLENHLAGQVAKYAHVFDANYSQNYSVTRNGAGARYIAPPALLILINQSARHIPGDKLNSSNNRLLAIFINHADVQVMTVVLAFDDLPCGSGAQG